MDEHTVFLDEHVEGILKQAAKDGLGKSEAVRRALRLAAVIVDIEGLDALPPDGGKEEMANWVKNRYPPDQWPEGFTESK